MFVLVRLFQRSLIRSSTHWLELSGFWISPYSIPYTWTLRIICSLMAKISPSVSIQCWGVSNGCWGTSGKLALAIRRGRILPSMTFHCCKEACRRTYSRKWASECACLVKEVWVVQTPCRGACRSHPPLWKGLSVPNLCAQSLVKRKLWMTSKIPVSLCEPLGKIKVHKI